MPLHSQFQTLINQARETQKTRRKALKTFDNSPRAILDLDAINQQHEAALIVLAEFVMAHREALDNAIRQFDASGEPLAQNT